MTETMESTLKLAKTRILIVEDEGIIARDLETRVRKAGYDVAGIVETGEAVLKATDECCPDLVLMDIRLRGEMDGIEAARQLQLRHNIPVIYLTAHTERETLNRAKLTGPFGYLVKPVSAATLPTSIELALYKHRVEHKLRQQRAWLRTSLETMADGMIIVDQLGRIQYLNPAGETITGWTADDALGQPVGDVLRLFHPDEDGDFDTTFLASLLDRKPSAFPVEIKLLTRNDETMPVEGTVSPSSEDGTSVGAVITFRDTTMRREDERERRLQHKMQAVGRLAAGIAHDFNNFLTVILGYTDLLLAGKNEFTPLTIQSLEEIRQAGNSAATLTQQLLTFSNHRVTDPHSVNLNELILESEQLCRSLLGETVEWTTSLDASARQVYADPSQLTQVLMNLVVNASDAMPQGGVLTIKTENIELASIAVPGTTVAEQYVMLSVTDTGVGIDDELADHIFEPFLTTKADSLGTGLGLSIVHTIVTDLGGTISVNSKPGEGATFRVFLPVAGQMTARATAEAPSPCERSTATATVLLVDDNPAVRGLLAMCLQAGGYRILEAQDGHRAIALATSHPGKIDALVTDIKMPKMGGFDLAARVREALPDIAILFVSGYAGTDNGQFELPARAAFLQKPFLNGDLLAQLEKLLNASVRKGAV